MGSMGNRARDPTPAEIRKRCKEFQAQWTKYERRKRLGVTDEPTWTPPPCSVDEDVELE